MEIAVALSATAGSTGRARLLQLLGPAVDAAGAELEDLSVSPAGRRQVVRVVVDRDGGIDLDDVAAVARAVSEVLDAADEDEPTLLGGAYVLEVSSPGVDRPLTAARHWRRSTGRLVTAELGSGEVLTGRVQEAGEVEVVLSVDGAARRVLLAEVVRAHVQVEFRHADGPDAGGPDAGGPDAHTDGPDAGQQEEDPA